MKIEKVLSKGKAIAVIGSDDILITDTQSALDLMMTIQYEADTYRVALSKANIEEAFFSLSSGLAGEVLQKFINYGIKLAVFGDYTKYTSKPLQDFIFESNKGVDIFFVADQEQAIEKLSAV